MSSYINDFKNSVLNLSSVDVLHPSLKISENGNILTQYAPFDYINFKARIVLLGITPGTHQANAALNQFKMGLEKGLTIQQSLKDAKEFASFSGPMRSNLVKMLDSVGAAKLLEVDSCARLFDSHAGIVHYTSALRYPVFMDGKNYSGSPSILSLKYFKDMIDTWLADEVRQLSNALWVPLGKEPTSAIEYLVNRGLIPSQNVIKGLPHPSGANAERIAYFTGRKSKESLSSRTNPEKLDGLKFKLKIQINNLITQQQAAIACR